MTSDEIKRVYLRVLLAYPLPLLVASEGARAMVARDSLARWWEVEL